MGGGGGGGEGGVVGGCSYLSKISEQSKQKFLDISIYCHFIVSVVTALNPTQTIQNLHN